MDKAAIIQKVKDKQPLTDEEEYFYLTEVMNIPADDASAMIERMNNKDHDIIID